MATISSGYRHFTKAEDLDNTDIPEEIQSVKKDILRHIDWDQHFISDGKELYTFRPTASCSQCPEGMVKKFYATYYRETLKTFEAKILLLSTTSLNTTFNKLQAKGEELIFTRLQGIPHENVALAHRLFYFQNPQGTPFQGIAQIDYVMGDLYTCLSEEKFKTDLKNRVSIKIGLTSGLKFLHEHGIIHRDVKPENVVINHLGRDFIPKYIDFGASIIADSPTFEERFKSVQTCGTPDYMSLENLEMRTTKPSTFSTEQKVKISLYNDRFGLGAIYCFMDYNEMPDAPGILTITPISSKKEYLQKARDQGAFNDYPRPSEPDKQVSHDLLNPIEARRPELSEVIERLQAIELD